MLETALRAAAARGFTLIELMVALAILGIVMVLGLPSYNRWIANTQIRSAAESIQNGLRLAAAEAVRRNSQVDFVLTADAAPHLGSAPDAAGASWLVRSNPPAPSVPELIDAKPAAEATRSVRVSASTPVVSFTGLGRLAPGSAMACVRLTNPPDGDRPLLVTVTAGGSVRMCNPAFPPTDPQGCPPAEVLPVACS